jgi:hypothetical protein
MSAVLRATGKEFDVDAFLVGSSLEPCAVYHRGEVRFPQPRPAVEPRERSGLHVVASVTEFVDFPQQVAEATSFLQAHAEEIRRLASFPGVEGVELDFGIERRNVAVQNDRLPADLIRVAGSLGLSINMSQYWLASTKDTP